MNEEIVVSGYSYSDESKSKEAEEKSLNRESLTSLLPNKAFTDMVYDLFRKCHKVEMSGCPIDDFCQGRISVIEELLDEIAACDGGSALIGKLHERFYDERNKEKKDE